MNQTMLNPLFYFLSGAASMGAFVCGIFFLRIWVKVSDKLFTIFGIAFVILGAERVVSLPIRYIEPESRLLGSALRIFAFAIILLGIWDKNRARSKARPQIPSH